MSTRQLKALGYSRSSASKANGVGRLKRLHRGVYAVGHTRLTWHSRCMAAVLACRPSVASHWSAAWLWGFIGSAPSSIHLTVPTKRHPKAGFYVHFSFLPGADLSVVEEIPLTAWPRTLLDIAPLVSPKRLGKFLKRAEELKFLDLRSLDELLGRTRGHRGHTPLRLAVAAFRPEVRVLRSDVERDFLELVRAAGLPLPATNFVVGPYELDAYWEAERFAVEIDVFATHGSRQSFESDRQREDDLLLEGIEVIRVTDVRLEREPEAVVARVAAHLRRRRARGPG